MEAEKTIQTYATSLPDRAGAFMNAGIIFSRLGMNITRVSYNKAVDLTMLFIDAEGTPAQHDRAHALLEQSGFIKEGTSGDVVLLDFNIPDRPGHAVKVLEVISKYNFNISYINAISSDEPVQHFRMGLFVDDMYKFDRFLETVRRICPVRIIDYDQKDINYDNTIFYGSFSDSIAEELDLDDDDREVILNSTNLAMQMLDGTGLSPYTTFSNIAKCASYLAKSRGEGYVPRITEFRLSEETDLTLIEPPCGSNIAFLRHGEDYLFVDTGHSLYKKELTDLLREKIPGWDSLPKKVVLTHPDLDHCGLINMFDEVYVNSRSAESLVLESQGRECFRETKPLNKPYIRLCKTMTSYETPDPSKLRVIWNSPDHFEGLFEPIGSLAFGDMMFSVYEGSGGHVPGEIVLIDYENNVVFSGDIYVNVKNMIPVQADFNRVAPVLMTSVDTDPKRCTAERKLLFEMLPQGTWTVFGAHGAAYIYESEGSSNDISMK